MSAHLITSFAEIYATYIVAGMLVVLFTISILKLYQHYDRVSLEKKRLAKEIEEQRKIVELQSRQLAKVEISRASMFKNMMEKIEIPLSSILGFNHAIMLNRYGHANKNIQGASRMALNNGQQILGLVEHILELASFENGPIPLNNKTIYFYSYVVDIYQSFLEKAEAKKIHIGFNYQLSKDLRLSLDTEKFERVFDLLLKHAIRVSPPKSQIIITLEMSKNEENIHLIVEDAGEGLEEGMANRIFECHVQSECRDVFQTYGLMPALVRSYVDLLEGAISVEGRKDKGTVFCFSFPPTLSDDSLPIRNVDPITPQIKSDISPHTSENKIENEEVVFRKKYRGLIISHDEVILEIMGSYLSESYFLLYARDRNETLEVLQKYGNKVDFMICGGKLSCQNSFQLLCEVKSNEKWKHLPLLVVTDEVKASLRIRSLTMGIDEYLTMPIQEDKLLGRIEQIVKLTAERDEWHVRVKEQACKKVQITEADLKWLTELEEIAQKEMCNRQFNLADLAYRMATSERQLFRKVKDLTGKTPNEYLKELRLYSAKKLLEDYTYATVAEIAYAVGFQDPYYFSKVYEKRFKRRPSDYLLKARAAS